jgi:hypothetical protein
MRYVVIPFVIFLIGFIEIYNKFNIFILEYVYKFCQTCNPLRLYLYI